jgi:hypothetical protein
MKIPIVKLSKKAVIILSSSIVVLVAVGGTSAYAAQSNALPGSILYPFKKAWEDVALLIAPTPEIKAQTYLNIAQNRIDALKETTPVATVQVIQQTQDHLQSALTESDKISDPTKRQEVKDSVAKEVSDVETEIETHDTASSSDQQDVKNTQSVKDQNAQLKTDASKDN